MNAIHELKRLQKEIDDFKKKQKELIQSGWGKSEFDLIKINHKHYRLAKTIEANQQKIKEIIESL